MDILLQCTIYVSQVYKRTGLAYRGRGISEWRSKIVRERLKDRKSGRCKEMGRLMENLRMRQ